MSLADLVHIERGLAADRPSSPVGKRRGWYATDTDVLSIHDGTGWHDIGGASVSFNTPAIVLGSSAAAGSGSDVIRHNSTIAAFDATNPTTQAFGDAAAVGTAAFAARRDHKHAMPSLPAGSLELVYRYTVTGSAKASIDTGSDTPDAGSNSWSAGDLLEVWMYLRTDEAVVASTFNITVNNDSSAIYDLEQFRAVNATVTGGPGLAGNSWIFSAPGASCASGVFGVTEMKFPNFNGTVGNKYGTALTGIADTTAANTRVLTYQLGYRSTTALSRLAIAPVTAAKNFIVGSQLLVYKRLAA